jgi:hypothetical protein
MMMAHDSTSNDPMLEPDTLAALDEALGRFLREGGSVEPLEPALRQIATEARQKRMRAEQLLIVLKDAWYALPGIGHAHDDAERNAMLQRVVTACIRCYYAA